MESLVLTAIVAMLSAAPAVAQTRVQVSVGVAVPAVHGRVVVVTGHPRVGRGRVVVVRRPHHHHGARRALVAVRSGHRHWHAHHRSHSRHPRYR